MPPEEQTDANAEEVHQEYSTENSFGEQTSKQTEVPPVYDEKAIRMAEIERKKAELRRKMEEASKASRAKKGFMTPDRKKRLRLLIRKKAAEELRKEQERKAEERRWFIEERCGEPEDLEWANKDDLQDICEYYYQRIYEIESEKWDIEREIRRQHLEIIELNTKVNDLRGKFQRPILKKVSKFENKFAKLQRKAAEYNFRNQLKMVHLRHDHNKEEDKKQHGDKNDDKKEPEDQTEEENSCAEEIITEPQPTEEENETLPENFTTEEGESRLDAVEKWVEENQRVNSEDTQEEEDRRLEEGGLATEGESRLDGDAAATTEEQGPEERAEYEPLSEAERRELGENLTEGQSPEEGEVQPEEDAPTRDVIRNEEDVWRFLKESVSSTHPSTVHQFVQELIETLQHVPQEYLKPVVEANIKRATTPSVTDSEHLRDGALTPHEGDRHGSELAVEEPEGLREDAGVEDAVVTLSNDLQLHSSRADLTASNEELKSGPTEDSGRGYPYIEAAD